MALPSVDALSLSSGEPSCAAASDVDSDCAENKEKRGQKRKRLPLDDQVGLRATLGKRCLCVKWNCFEKFTRDSDFEELLRFRGDWCAMHKLDQDRMES